VIDTAGKPIAINRGATHRFRNLARIVVS